jgi:heme-degrading monooxygenase HmoA
MAVCLVIDIPGGTLEQYDAVKQALGESGGMLGDGQTFHAAGPTDDGFVVIDVWNSRDDFDRFIAGRLGEAIQAAGVPEPQIREIPVHNEERG